MRRGAYLRQAIVLAGCCLLAPAAGAHAATFTVSSTADSGAGSLRQAILSANATSGPDEIHFAIGTGAQEIAPLSALPEIDDEVIVNAATQPGYSGTPLITLSGTGAPAGNGFHFRLGSKNSSVLGIRVFDWPNNGIAITDTAISVDACYVDSSGFDGISVDGAGGALIGTTNKNVITNNAFDGIRLHNSDGNRIARNWIGLAPDGVTSAGNGSTGVDLTEGSTGTVVGGTLFNHNTIVDNAGPGVSIDGPASNLNRVENNSIGVRQGATSPQGNGNGVVVSGGAHDNVVGGGNFRINVISGNGAFGVSLSGTGTTGNEVSGNFVGVGDNGVTSVPNLTGVEVGSGAAGNTIGGLTPEKRNVIGWNSTGVRITGSGTTGNLVQGNDVGVNIGGRTRAPNDRGVVVEHASGNTIGAVVAGPGGNVISANLEVGVQVWLGSSDTVIQGNTIGLASNGTAARGNGLGVFIGGGGPSNDRTVLERNVISANDDGGVLVSEPADHTLIGGNYVGLDASGTVNRGNDGNGVETRGAGTTNTTIGGTGSGAGNVISGNRSAGILLHTGSADVLGNRIGTTASGAESVPPVQQAGVVTVGGSGVRIGGTAAAAGNTIAFNSAGVSIFSSDSQIPIRGNRIFSNGPGLGIDLGLDGVTANDPSDTDVGANGLQNFPVVNSAVTDAGETRITGVLDSAQNDIYRVELFASDTCGPLGNGEGQRLIVPLAVTTINGHAAFSFTASPALPAGQVVTATATSFDGNTSEFSACRVVTVPPPPPAAPPPASPAPQQTVTEPPRDDPVPPAVIQPAQEPPAVLPVKLPASSLTAPRRLRLAQLRAVAVTFAPDSDGDYVVGGFIAVPGLKGSARQFKRRVGKIKSGQAAKIKLIPPRKLIDAARKSLRRRSSLKAELSVKLTGPTNQVRTLKRTIQIVR